MSNEITSEKIRAMAQSLSLPGEYRSPFYGIDKICRDAAHMLRTLADEREQSPAVTDEICKRASDAFKQADPDWNEPTAHYIQRWRTTLKAIAPLLQSPDRYCRTTPDGNCVSEDPHCMHQKPAVVVNSGADVDAMNLRHGERYGVDWIYAELQESLPASPTPGESDAK